MMHSKVTASPRLSFFFFCLFLLVLLPVSQAWAQKLPKDSLWKEWKNTANADTNRLFAIGYLCSKYYWFTDPDSALVLADLQYNFAQARHNKRYLAISMMKKSGAYVKKGDYQSSLRYSLKSLPIFREIHHESGIASCLNNIGQDYMDLGRNEEAVSYFYQALGHFERLGDKNFASKAYSNIGRLYALMEQPDSAVRIFARCLELEKEQQNYREVSYICNSMAQCYLNLDDTARARAFLDEALILHKQNKDPLGEAEVLYLLGQIRIKALDFAAAGDRFRRSLAICRQYNLKGSSADNLLALAELDEKKGADQQAIEKAREALEISRSEKVPTLHADLQLLLSRLLEKHGQHAEALSLYKKAIANRDSSSKEKLKSSMYREQLKHDFERKQLLAKAAYEKQLTLINAAADRRTFQQKIWLIISISAALLFLLCGFFIYKYLRQKNTITAQKNDLLKQQLLVSQMNPHFIFNSLNAIQNFIFKQDSYQAGIYLKQFAELIRMILDFSTRDRISLEEEVHFLNTYLQLQKLRFNTGFHFELHIDPALETALVMVPPMLAQPFIENAIEHGIFHKNGEGFLSIKINASGDTLVYEIEDNGIGLEESSRINRENKPQHRSMAIAITRERLEKINTGRQGLSEVQVVNRRQLQEDKEGVYVKFATPFFTL